MLFIQFNGEHKVQFLTKPKRLKVSVDNRRLPFMLPLRSRVVTPPNANHDRLKIEIWPNIERMCQSYPSFFLLVSK